MLHSQLNNITALCLTLSFMRYICLTLSFTAAFTTHIQFSSPSIQPCFTQTTRTKFHEPNNNANHIMVQIYLDLILWDLRSHLLWTQLGSKDYWTLNGSRYLWPINPFRVYRPTRAIWPIKLVKLYGPKQACKAYLGLTALSGL